MTNLPQLAAALRARLGQEIGIGVASVATPQTAPIALHAREFAATARMTPKRRREFTAGRSAARMAMTGLGLPAGPVPAGPDRAPRWPQGLCGSISHTAQAAVAVVARQTNVSGLGIDIEEDNPLERDLWDSILTPAEQAWLTDFPPQDHGRVAKSVFSAKEALYKAQYPLTGQILSFHDVSLIPAPGGFAVVELQTARDLQIETILCQRIADLVWSFTSVRAT